MFTQKTNKKGEEVFKLQKRTFATLIGSRCAFQNNNTKLFRSPTAGLADVLVRRGTIPRSCAAEREETLGTAAAAPVFVVSSSQWQPQDRPRQVDLAE